MAEILNLLEECPEGFYKLMNEDGLDLLLHLIYVDIAYYDDTLQIGAIPFLVEIAECLWLEIVDDGCVADDIPFRILGVAVENGQRFGPNTSVGVGPCSPFLTDDPSFFVDFIGFHGDESRPVVEDEQGRVHDAIPVGWHRGQVVYGLVEGGVGVDVGAEFHSDGFKVVDQGFARKMGRSVESDMFKEVSQTVLAIFFQDGTHILHDIEVCSFRHHVVVTDIVGQTVFHDTIP